MEYYCQALLPKAVMHWALESSLHVSVEITAVQMCQVADLTSGSQLYAGTVLNSA